MISGLSGTSFFDELVCYGISSVTFCYGLLALGGLLDSPYGVTQTGPLLGEYLDVVSRLLL